MICSDPYIKYIKGLGFNILRVPNDLYEPYRLLESDGSRQLRVVGLLGRDARSDLGGVPPEVRRDIEVADISVERTRRLRGTLALPLLRTLFEAAGLGGASASGSLALNDAVSLSLRDVKSDRVDPLQVMAFLEAGVEPSSAYLSEIAANGKLYLVTSTLKTNSFELRMKRGAAHELAGQLGPGGAQVEVSTYDSSEEESRVVIVGNRVLPFAFQALRMQVESGVFVGYRHISGAVGFASPVSSGTLPLLSLDDDLVEES